MSFESTETKEAKARIAQRAAEQEQVEKKTKGGKPWYVNLLVWLFDFVAAIAILALAVKGGVSLIDAGITNTQAIGIATVVVGILAMRLIDRIFDNRV